MLFIEQSSLKYRQYNPNHIENQLITFGLLCVLILIGFLLMVPFASLCAQQKAIANRTINFLIR